MMLQTPESEEPDGPPDLGDFAVCLDHAIDGGWRWRLIDLEGVAAASGAELTQGTALRAAINAAHLFGAA